MVIASKSYFSVQRTVDFQPINKHARCQTHAVDSPFNKAEKVSQNTFTTVTDAWDGYHSIPLNPGDRHQNSFSRLGADSSTELPRRDSKPVGMHIINALMKLFPTLRTGWGVWMTL